LGTAQREGRKVWKKFKVFDLFPKSADEVKDKTPSGGLVTLVGAILMFLLLGSEFVDYLNPQAQHSVFIDTSIGGTMPIYFDFSIISIRCEDIRVDVVDDAGQHITSTPSVTKTPINGEQELIGDWYYKMAYRRAMMDKVYDSSTYTGCLIRGAVEVAKTKGNFHIAAGASSSQQHDDHQHHIHRLRPKDISSIFNVTHRINWLNIGPTFPGKIDPLTGVTFIHSENNNVQMNYLLKIVPTVYEDSSGNQKDSFQYSATEHKHVIDFTQPSFPLPGLFFKWEISPYIIKQSESGYSFSRFLTRVCAVLGGTFVVLGLVYKALNRAYNAVKEKIN